MRVATRTQRVPTALRTARGQALLLAVIIMLLILLVGALFVAAVVFVGLAGPVVGLIPDFTIHDLSALDFLADLFSNNVPVAAFAIFGL
ncbi:MAG: hypothetical protein ACE5O2_01275, partial [Armatimonadota bacterium]